MGAYILFDGGALHFDVVQNESVVMSATIAKHPVEDGPNVADHVIRELDRVRLDVFISNSPIDDVNGRGATVQPIATGLGVNVDVLRFPQSFDAVKDTIATLEKFWDDGTLLDVVTHAKFMPSMVIENVESKPKGDSAELTIQLSRVRLVETKSVKLAPKPKEPRGQPTVSKGTQQPKPKQSLAVGIFQSLGLIQ